MKNTHARRVKLLELEGKGFSRSEIVKELSASFQVCERTVQYDFEHRDQWQVYRDDDMLLTILNRYQQIYRSASVKRYEATSDRAQQGWVRIMLEATKQLSDLYVLPGVLRRVEQLREQIGKGVYICHETLSEYSKTSRRK